MLFRFPQGSMGVSPFQENHTSGFNVALASRSVFMRLLVCGVAEQRSMPLGGERKERRQSGEETALAQPAFPRSAGRSLWVSSGSYGPHGRDLGR